MTAYDFAIDARNLNCPLPLLRLKKALRDMNGGEVIRVKTTDPAAHLDFGVYAEQTGNLIIEFIEEGDNQVFFVKKK